MRARISLPFLVVFALLTTIASRTVSAIDIGKVDAEIHAVEPDVIRWRQDIHQNPELSNREVRTAKIAADHLMALGLTVETGVAHTGVVGFLKGQLPGPTIALRADMDALPVTERTNVPFKSNVRTTYRGETVGVMHACGHDVHTAVLMGIAQVLTRLRMSLRGNVLFIFQPAEEGAPEGEEGGASLMLKEGLFEKYRPQAIFGLHVWPALSVGEVGLRVGPFMAASDSWTAEILGKQAHGARPWQGIDPIVTSAQIVNGLQTVVSRSVDLTLSPAVVTIGAIKGGVRNNIIPERVEMMGTIRTFDPSQRAAVIAKIKRIVEGISAANGASATLTMQLHGIPVTSNDPALTEKMLPTLRRVLGKDNVREMALVTVAEDFAFYTKTLPSLFFMVGSTPASKEASTAPSSHSDDFYVDEQSIPVALRALTHVAVEYLSGARGVR